MNSTHAIFIFVEEEWLLGIKPKIQINCCKHNYSCYFIQLNIKVYYFQLVLVLHTEKVQPYEHFHWEFVHRKIILIIFKNREGMPMSPLYDEWSYDNSNVSITKNLSLK